MRRPTPFITFLMACFCAVGGVAVADSDWTASNECYVALLIEKTDTDAALALCEEQFAAGEARSGYWLAVYHDGNGDAEKSLMFYEQAAAKGEVLALNMLGIINFPKDNELGLDYLRQAAEKNDAYSQYVYAHIHDRVKSVKRNLPLAWEYYNKAADNGDPHGMLKVGVFYLHRGSSGECLDEEWDGSAALREEYAELNISCDQEKGLEYLKRAAAIGMPMAMYALGNAYRKKRNVEEATRWYNRFLKWNEEDYLDSGYANILSGERFSEQTKEEVRNHIAGFGDEAAATDEESGEELFKQYARAACGYDYYAWYYKCQEHRE